ncbi:DnaJ domain-containing protein [Phycomyces nitens]|nr:DnaJ domain-containing protein [Phycomyces nitens]
MDTKEKEALNCLSFAKSEYGNGNIPAALSLTKKSLGLFPTDQAKEFLQKIKMKMAEPSTKETPNSASGPRQRPTAAGSQSENASSDKYTSEQVMAVKEILACGTNYYKVLKLRRDCTEVEIKKSYRKLALQFHPDKNSAPGADEAFKLISKAFTVLSDPQKKAIHDSSGGDPEQRGNAGASFASAFSNARGFHRGGMGEEISPEDLFNTFFNGGFGESFGGPGFSSATFVGPGFRTQTFYTSSGGGGRTAQAFTQQTAYPWWTYLIQLLPLIILVGYAFVTGVFETFEKGSK